MESTFLPLPAAEPSLSDVLAGASGREGPDSVCREKQWQQKKAHPQLLVRQAARESGWCGGCWVVVEGATPTQNGLWGAPGIACIGFQKLWWDREGGGRRWLRFILV